jgi:hypothetical protein
LFIRGKFFTSSKRAFIKIIFHRAGGGHEILEDRGLGRGIVREGFEGGRLWWAGGYVGPGVESGSVGRRRWRRGI